jgi:colicin import membrane protein
MKAKMEQQLQEKTAKEAAKAAEKAEKDAAKAAEKEAQKAIKEAEKAQLKAEKEAAAAAEKAAKEAEKAAAKAAKEAEKAAQPLPVKRPVGRPKKASSTTSSTVSESAVPVLTDAIHLVAAAPVAPEAAADPSERVKQLEDEVAELRTYIMALQATHGNTLALLDAVRKLVSA